MNNDHLSSNPRPRWKVVVAASLLSGSFLLAATLARADGFGPSTMSAGSANLAGGSLSIVAGSPLLLVGVPDFSIVGVEHLAKGVKLSLKGTAESAALVLMVPVAVAAGSALVVGGTVTAVAMAGGWVLSCAGQTIGFVAREASASLLHHQRVDSCCPSCC